MKSTAKLNEWRQLSDQALKDNLGQLREILRFLRFLSASGKLKNVREVKELRKDIARLATILKDKTK